MDSLREDLESVFADWSRVPKEPVDEDMSEAINAEYCHTTFADRTWQSLDEDDLYSVLWSCHHYFVPEASVALLPALIRASSDDLNWMFECLTLIDTMISHDRLSGLKGVLSNDQIECLVRFRAQVEEMDPIMTDVASKLLDLVSAEP